MSEFQLEQYSQLFEDAARKHRVVSEIHPKDFIFHFLIENPTFDEKHQAVQYYFDDGAHSADKLSRLVHEYYGETNQKIQLFEFASGYGCVTRHLMHYLPNTEITSCDIHEEAVEFIQDKIGISAILSNSVPEQLHTPCQYDVIFALSFFSHMPRSTWRRWLITLASRLKPDGLLIFTTHGLESRKYFDNPQVEPEGFWFIPMSEQKDLDTTEYGQTIVLPSFVFNQLSEENDLRIILYKEAHWWEHQDLYVMKRNES